MSILLLLGRSRKPKFEFSSLSCRRGYFLLSAGEGTAGMLGKTGWDAGSHPPRSPACGYRLLCCIPLMGFNQGTGSQRLSHAGSLEMEEKTCVEPRQKEPSHPRPTQQIFPERPWSPLGSARIYFLWASPPAGTSGDTVLRPSDSLNVFNGTSRSKESRASPWMLFMERLMARWTQSPWFCYSGFSSWFLHLAAAGNEAPVPRQPGEIINHNFSAGHRFESRLATGDR